MSGITVGVDASENSDRALEWAMQEGAIRGVPVTAIAVHGVAVNEWTGNPMVVGADRPEEEKIRQAAEEKVAKIAGRIGKPVEVNVKVVSGVASKVLIDASEHADLVVVGTRGGGGFGKLIMGSVSNQVLHHAACPVTLVR